MLVADINPITKNVHIIGKLTTEVQESLKLKGWRKVKNKTEFFAPYDIYLKSKPTISELYEADPLKTFINNLTDDSYNILARVDDYLERECPIRLYPFQKEFVRWYKDPLKTNNAAFNACEPGLGKSFMALASAMCEGEADLIILCPRNAIGVWKEHLSKFKYSKEVRLGFSPGEGCCISTYEGVAPLIDEANEKKKPIDDYKKLIKPGTLLIADEFHLCKNNKAKKTLRFKKLFQMVKDVNGKALVLTGTPIMNRPMELKTLLENIDLFKKSFGNSNNFYKAFGGEFNFYLKRLIWDEDKRSSKDIKDALKHVLFIRKKEDVVSQLPDIIETEIRVEVSKGQKKELDSLFDKYKDKDILKLDDYDISKYTQVREALSIEKYKISLETIENFEDIGKPILVFCDFVIPVEALGTRPGWKAITGNTSAKKREEYAEEFNKGNLKGLALTIRAGSTALSLTGTDTALFIDLNLVPGANIQAKNRINRINKLKSSLYYIYFVGDHPMEAQVVKILKQKEKLVQEAY